MSTEVEKLAEQGDAEAQCSLAFLFEIGLDRDVDLEMALHWWKKAAAQGHPIALEKVGELSDAEESLDEDEKPGTPGRLVSEVKEKVLLIEDEDDLRSILENELEENGYSVLAVEDGKSALNLLISNPDIQVIVTDLKMPKMNGIQFIKTIRKMRVALNPMTECRKKMPSQCLNILVHHQQSRCVFLVDIFRNTSKSVFHASLFPMGGSGREYAPTSLGLAGHSLTTMDLSSKSDTCGFANNLA